MSIVGRCHLRVARPTNNIEALRPFYCEGLGFKVLFEFEGHAGFNGLILGDPEAGHHLEFTSKDGHDSGRAPGEDNLLVFYLPDRKAYEAAIARMKSAGFEPVRAFNEYWDRVGKTFQDPDGYRVVLQNAGWTNEKGQYF